MKKKLCVLFALLLGGTAAFFSSCAGSGDVDDPIPIEDVVDNGDVTQDCLQDAKWIPMADIVKAPYCINEENGTILYFYCQKGYQSEIAAKCVAEAGFEHVYYFGMK